MNEVEVKIIEVNKKQIEEQLRALGAATILDADEDTIFFDFQDNSITDAQNLLRLRRIGNKTTLTFKKFVESDSAKVRVEHEVVVSEFETAKSILESLDLRVTLQMRKHRTSYRLPNSARVDIDKYVGEYSHSNLLGDRGRRLDRRTCKYAV